MKKFKLGLLDVCLHDESVSWRELTLSLMIPRLVDLPLMEHIVWVLTPYLSKEKIRAIALKCGHYLCPCWGECDGSCIPF